MEQIPEWVKTAGLIIGVPLYLFLIARWVSMAIFRSYFETKQEFKED
jgi:hypothetical protein